MKAIETPLKNRGQKSSAGREIQREAGQDEGRRSEGEKAAGHKVAALTPC